MFRTGQKVPESGIYRVIHAEHRLPHEVTLLRDTEFPRCSKCKEQVTFEMLSVAPRLDQLRERTILHQLPEISDEPAA